MTHYAPRAISAIRKARNFVFLALAALAITIAFGGAPSQASDNPKVKEAMESLKTASAALGAPKLDGENLMFGTNKVNEDYTIVDSIKAKHEATATFFAKKGENFVRVSTNVMKDGKRAIGSNLDPSGPAIAAIKQGKPYYGLVDILGKIYDTGYEPIKAANGDVIGVYYVGFIQE